MPVGLTRKTLPRKILSFHSCLPHPLSLTSQFKSTAATANRQSMQKQKGETMWTGIGILTIGLLLAVLDYAVVLRMERAQDLRELRRSVERTARCELES